MIVIATRVTLSSIKGVLAPETQSSHVRVQLKFLNEVQKAFTRWHARLAIGRLSCLADHMEYFISLHFRVGTTQR